MKSSPTIEYPKVVARSDWLSVRKTLLEKEKELTRLRDRINTMRRELPMVEIEDPYVFSGSKKDFSLLDMFEGRRQLIIYHFMWLWENGIPKERPCPSCSGWADSVARGQLSQLHNCGTTLALVSRAPYEIIAPFKKQMGWKMPWYSSAGNSFNKDFEVTIDPADSDPVYNYRTRSEHASAGSEYYYYSEEPFDLPGISCFLRIEDKVYHTYSTYGRGGESIGGGYYFLDLTALGRQEDWEKPDGRNLGMGAKAGSDSIKYPDQQDEVKSEGCCQS